MRRVLALIFTAAAAYLAVLAVLISLRLVPGFRDSVSESRGSLVAFGRVSRAIEHLDRSIASLAELVALGPASLATARPSARERIPREGILEAARLAYLPAPLRIGLAAAAETESDIGNLLQRLVTELELGDARAADRSLEQVREARDVLARQLDRALQAGYTDVADRQQLFAEAARLAWQALAAWLALGVLLVPALWLWLSRRFIAPMAELDAALTRVTAGDLDVRLEPRYDDELGRLGHLFNSMVALLHVQQEVQAQEMARLRDRLAALEPIAGQLDDATRREEGLRRALTLHAEAQRVARLGSYEFDLRTTHVTCSAETCAIFGVETARFGATWEDFLRFVHPQDADALQSRLHACVNDDIALDLTHRIVRADGTPGVVRHRGSVTRDASGRAIRVVGTIQIVSGTD